MRRILSLILAMAILFSLMIVGSVTAYADEVETPEVPEDTSLKMSDEGIDMIKSFEGFSAKPYWDVNQWTVGYGTYCPSDKVDEYKENGIPEEEADALLRDHVSSYENAVNNFAEKYSRELTQYEFDALVCFTYNLGRGWMYTDSNFRKTVVNADASDAEVIFWFGAYCSAGGNVLSGLVRRRMAEANLYLNGVYGTSRPSNYCYVKLNANGGDLLDSRINAYDINTTERIEARVESEGYTFEGWFTEKTGGTQVTFLDESTHGQTLYAHWSGDGPQTDSDNNTENGENTDEGTNPPSEEPETTQAVTVTVTADDVNLRKGPGTNYTTIGQANKGDQLTITQVTENGGRVWGGTADNVWICLTYTNYDEVTAPEAPEATPDEPSVEQPEVTPDEPSVEQPEVTPDEPSVEQPEVTPDEPSVEEPEETPEESEPKLMGTVKVNDALTIRSGPGTGYSKVGYLHNNDRVEILEQKVVGAVTWGRIKEGWISLQYVVLDETEEEPEQTPDAPPAEEPEQPPVETPEETPDEPAGIVATVKVSSSLLIREGPGTSYDVAGSYKNGTVVTILEQKTVGNVTWGRTDKGWISMNYVVLGVVSDDQDSNDDSSTENKPEEEKEVTGTVDVSDVLRIRSGPDTSYPVVGYYRDGDKVTILDTKKVGSVIWGQTDKGWISIQYIDLDTPIEEPKDIRTVTASCLTVRSGAGTGYRAVDYLYYGEKVEILEIKTVKDVQWGKIATGWICLDYVK